MRLVGLDVAALRPSIVRLQNAVHERQILEQH